MANLPAIIGRGPFDQILIDGFSSNLSAEEVAESTGGVLTPAQCLSRLSQLVKSKDVLDAKQKLSLLLDDVYWVRNKLRKQMEDANYVTKDDATIYLKTLDTLVGRIETANLGLSDAMLKFNEVRAAEFIEALGFITAKMFELLADKHPEIEMSDLNTIVLEAIPESIPEVK